MDEPVTRAEYNEFCKRIEESHDRINARLRLLEENTKQMTDIAVSVKELAMSVKQMAEEQKSQCNKIEKLESRDGEMWRKVVGYIVTTIVGILIGFVFQQIGMN